MIITRETLEQAIKNKKAGSVIANLMETLNLPEEIVKVGGTFSKLNGVSKENISLTVTCPTSETNLLSLMRAIENGGDIAIISQCSGDPNQTVMKFENGDK